MPVEMFAQPAMQRSKLPLCDLTRNIGMSFDSGGIKLRAENISDGVALKSAADGSAIPMHILQTAIAVIGRSNPEIGLHARAPGFGEILDASSPSSNSSSRSNRIMNEIISNLVGVRADQGALHLVDRAIKSLEPYPPELIWKSIAQNG